MLGDRNRVLPAIAAQSWSQQATSIHHYLFLFDGEERVTKLIKDWSKESEKCRDLRNQAIHSAYVRFEDGAEGSIQVHRSGKLVDRDLDVAALTEVYIRLREHYSAGERLMVELEATGKWLPEPLIGRRN